MRKFLVFLIFLGLSFSAISIDANIDKTLSPGDYGVIQTVVTNTGTDTIEGVVLEINGPAGFIYKSKYDVGDMNPGTTSIINIPIKVKNISSGIYVFTFKIYGYTTEGNSKNLNYKSASVAVVVENEPIFTIEYNHTIDKNGNFEFVIKNNGGIARNVEISFEPNLKNKDEIFVKEIESYHKENLTFNTENLNEGVNEIKVKIKYYDELGNLKNDEKTIYVNFDKENLELFFNQEEPIKTNKKSELKMKILNKGKKINDVKIYFDGIDLVNKEYIYFKSIEKEAYINEIVFNKLKPGINLVNITIKYKTDGVKKMEKKTIPIEIVKDNKINIYIDAEPTPLIIGKQGTLTVTIANMGSYEINSVSVYLNDSKDVKNLNVENEQFIGSLSKDDFSSVSYKIKINKPGKIKIKVKYKDLSGEWNVVEKSFKINAINEKKNNNFIIYLVGGIVLVGIGIYYLKMRK